MSNGTPTPEAKPQENNLNPTTTIKEKSKSLISLVSWTSSFLTLFSVLNSWRGGRFESSKLTLSSDLAYIFTGIILPNLQIHADQQHVFTDRNPRYFYFILDNLRSPDFSSRNLYTLAIHMEVKSWLVRAVESKGQTHNTLWEDIKRTIVIDY